jgi:hypothetical protein
MPATLANISFKRICHGEGDAPGEAGPAIGTVVRQAGSHHARDRFWPNVSSCQLALVKPGSGLTETKAVASWAVRRQT